MNTTDAFLENWINAKHTLLGKSLQPLSLRHLLWLHAIGSPLVLTSKKVEMADLELAAIICSSTSDAQLTFLHAKKLSFPFRVKESIWRFRNKRRDLREETLAFLAYQDDYLKLPEFWESEGKNKDCPLPYLLAHAATLIANTGWTEGEVFNLPMGKVIWLNLAFSYLKTGETNVMGDNDVLARDAIRALNNNKNNKSIDKGAV